MKQRRRTSLLESVVNVAAGLAVAIAGQLTIFSILGITVTSSQTGEIAAFMTALSVPRQYLVRRLFEYLRYTGIMQ